VPFHEPQLGQTVISALLIHINSINRIPIRLYHKKDVYNCSIQQNNTKILTVAILLTTTAMRAKVHLFDYHLNAEKYIQTFL